jgi:hypothetical protein
LRCERLQPQKSWVRLNVFIPPLGCCVIAITAPAARTA